MARTTPVIGTTTRRSVAAQRRPIKQRLILVLIAFAIVLLALGGWAAQGLRLTVTAWQQ